MIRLSSITVRGQSAAGLFVGTLEFSSGLQIISADNAFGKSLAAKRPFPARTARTGCGKNQFVVANDASLLRSNRSSAFPRGDLPLYHREDACSY